MQFAFSSNAFTNFSLKDSIKQISKVGYTGVEIMCDIPHAYPPTLTRQKIIEPSCLSFGPSAALHSPAHILICTGECALQTNQNPAQSGTIIFDRDPKQIGCLTSHVLGSKMAA